MREMIDWIGAEAERVEDSGMVRRRGRFSHEGIGDLLAHTFPGKEELTTEDTEEHGGGQNPQTSEQIAEEGSIPELSWEEERERRIYRARTVTMLRRYMRYSIETGRLPSLLGREFFRAKVTSYIVVTFEDRVIFVHDMETCLNRLDEFSRQIIARHILQEHDQEATARLLHCTDRTVRTYVPIALDLMTEILLDVGLLERIVPIREKSCQGGKTSGILVSGCEESKNKL
jgi:DNA-directed RNA polymerase specialized sigma24 family protein